MVVDDFGTERQRLERVLGILENAVARLKAGDDVPLSLLCDAVQFIRATEDAAYNTVDESDIDLPLSACVRQHVAARAPLEQMERTMPRLERGDADAPAAFARAAEDYIQRRREHLRADDRLFRRSAAPVASNSPAVAAVEPAAARHCYDRVIEAAGGVTYEDHD